jgi:hypothetical protein
MLEVYSLNVTAAAGAAFPLTSETIQKGCTAELVGAGSIQLNKCGVYMVAVNGSAAAASTIQLNKNGVLQPQAQSTGTSPAFVTLVQVPQNNTNCCCTSPVTLTVVNPTDASETLTSLNVVVTKVC